MTKIHLQKGINEEIKAAALKSEHRDWSIGCYLSEKYGLPSAAIAPELLDLIKIIAVGAKKYTMNNWLLPNGKRCSEKDMHDSMFHHLAESFVGKREDVDSKLDPLLHLACRALMLYTRRQRGIVHENDKTP